jgi:hypothetical protein
VIKDPGVMEVAGQASVTTIAGAVGTGQVAEAVFVTGRLVQLSRPIAVTLAVAEQVSARAVSVKVPDACGARLAAENRRGLLEKLVISAALKARLYKRASSIPPLKKRSAPPPLPPIAQLAFTVTAGVPALLDPIATPLR